MGSADGSRKSQKTHHCLSISLSGNYSVAEIEEIACLYRRNIKKEQGQRTIDKDEKAKRPGHDMLGSASSVLENYKIENL